MEERATQNAGPGGRGVVPPRVLAGPQDVGAAPPDAATPDFVTVFDGAVPFWRPSVADVAKGLGWKWLLLGPAVLFVIGLPGAMIFDRWYFLSWSGIKVWLLALGWAIYMVIGTLKTAVKARKDIFCIHCGYTLAGLGDEHGAGVCPECGRKFVRDLCDEYRKDPHFFVTRYKALRAYPAAPAPGFAAGEGPTTDDGTG